MLRRPCGYCFRPNARHGALQHESSACRMLCLAVYECLAEWRNDMVLGDSSSNVDSVGKSPATQRTRGMSSRWIHGLLEKVSLNNYMVKYYFRSTIDHVIFRPLQEDDVEIRTKRTCTDPIGETNDNVQQNQDVCHRIRVFINILSHSEYPRKNVFFVLSHEQDYAERKDQNSIKRTKGILFEWPSRVGGRTETRQ